jgi:hypothetical protein
MDAFASQPDSPPTTHCVADEQFVSLSEVIHRQHGLAGAWSFLQRHGASDARQEAAADWRGHQVGAKACKEVADRSFGHLIPLIAKEDLRVTKQLRAVALLVIHHAVSRLVPQQWIR